MPWVFADKTKTLDHLEDNIRRVIANIWPQMLEKIIENWTSRLDYIRASRGSPLPEIIFAIGHGHELTVALSRIGTLVPLETHPIEKVFQVKCVLAEFSR
ncbi:hypothetical protein TNCV_3047841 [Trichonephila clavipes]|nr:hypothetical protein TNCV_3047841 [Trichonephila clavipes]